MGKDSDYIPLITEQETHFDKMNTFTIFTKYRLDTYMCVLVTFEVALCSSTIPCKNTLLFCVYIANSNVCKPFFVIWLAILYDLYVFKWIHQFRIRLHSEVKILLVRTTYAYLDRKWATHSMHLAKMNLYITEFHRVHSKTIKFFYMVWYPNRYYYISINICFILPKPVVCIKRWS